jgi:hypothetical protein
VLSGTVVLVIGQQRVRDKGRIEDAEEKAVKGNENNEEDELEENEEKDGEDKDAEEKGEEDEDEEDRDQERVKTRRAERVTKSTHQITSRWTSWTNSCQCPQLRRTQGKYTGQSEGPQHRKPRKHPARRVRRVQGVW